jgi:hypothetical protein
VWILWKRTRIYDWSLVDVIEAVAEFHCAANVRLSIIGTKG